MLSAEVYQPRLTLQASLTLLDPRQLSDARVRENENFRDQLAAADIVVANKQDRWQEQDRQALAQWQAEELGDRQLIGTEYGRIDPALLAQPRRNLRALPQSETHQHSHPRRDSGLARCVLTIMRAGGAPLIRAGYYACGWAFDSETVFDTVGVLEWARGAGRTRKGVMRIPEGAVSINRRGADFRIETRRRRRRIAASRSFITATRTGISCKTNC